MPVSDAAEAVSVRRIMPMPAKPFRPAQILIVRWGDHRAAILRQAERGQRLVAKIDEQAEREQRRPPDPVLTMNEYAPARTHVLAREGHARVEQVLSRRQRVWSGQMEEGDTVLGEFIFVVPALLSKIDNGVDAMGLAKLRHIVGRKASADGELVREPAEILLKDNIS